MYAPLNVSVRKNQLAIWWAQKTGRLPRLMSRHDILALAKMKSLHPEREIYVRAIGGDKRQTGLELKKFKYSLFRRAGDDAENFDIIKGVSKIMFEMEVNGKTLHFKEVPGVHDITCPETSGGDSFDAGDAFHRLISIMISGFRGAIVNNVVFLGQKPEGNFSMFEYCGRGLSDDKMVESRLTETQGDRYRLVIWTGFSNNYTPYTDSEIYQKTGCGTVRFAPPKHIEPFIILNSELNIAQTNARIRFYKQEFEKANLECPKILSRKDYLPVEVSE